MATNTFTGTGPWTDTAKWSLGRVPDATDLVQIGNGSTSTVMTQNSGGALADSVILKAAATWVADDTQDTKITVDTTITTDANATAIADWNMSGGAAFKCEILTNNNTGSNNNAIVLSGDFDLIGASKTRWTYLSGAVVATATSATVDDATGWRQGDILVFCTTQAYNATPRVDVVTLNGSYTNGSTSLTWTGGLSYDHADNCIVGNLTRNLILGPASRSNADTGGLRIDCIGRATAAIIRDVMFDRCRQSSSMGGVFGANGNAGMQTLAEITGCAFYDWQGSAEVFNTNILGTATGTISRQDNLFYSTVASAIAISYSGISGRTIGDELSPVIFRAAAGIDDYPIGSQIIDPKISGCTTVGVRPRALVEDVMIGTGDYGGAGIWSCRDAVGLAGSTSSLVRLSSVRLGLGPHATNANYSAANNSVLLNPGSGNYSVEFYGCDENISGGSIWSAAYGLQSAQLRLFNRDLSADVQEVYSYTSFSVPTRNKTLVAAEFTRSTSGLVMTWTGTNADAWDAEIDVPVSSGVAARIMLYMAKSAAGSPVGTDVAYGASTLPYAEMSGLGMTPVRVTLDTDSVAGYDSGIHELAALDFTPVASGIMKLRIVGQSATTAAQCYFSGLPVSPFISGEVRHFGYIYNNQATRDRDSTVTISASDLDLPTPTELVASETTAAAIGGMTITWGATSSIELTANRSFQQLVDYVAAKACVNVSSAVPVTWAGVVGSPSIFAEGDIDVTGWELRGSGSLAMGSNTLTSDDVFSYTYTGGTFSQAAAVPTFAGGTLNIGAAGAYTFTQASGMTVSATPTAPSNYVLSAATFTGTLTFHNTSAHNITVEVPSGTTTSSAGSPGAGTVTFVAPVVTADISITGMSNTVGANNRLQIINSTAISAADWTANTVYATGDIVLRTSGIGSENTAGLYMRCTTAGTSGASEPTWGTTVGNTTTDGAGTLVWTTYAILYYDADPAATSLTDTYIDGEEFLAGETVEIRFAEEDPAVSFKTYSTSVVATADGFSALVNEEADGVYATYALSGAAQDAIFSPNFVSSYIVLDADTNFAGTEAFAYYCYLLTTSEGMYRFWGGLTALDSGNIRNNASVISLYFDESAGFVRQTDNVRIFRDDGLRPALDPTTGGSGIEINWRVPVNVVSTGGTALTTEEHNALLAVPAAATNANAVRTELATELARVTKLAALSGIDSTLVVTPTTRTAGSVSQTIDTVGDTTTVSTV